jgi:hypothetical protein
MDFTDKDYAALQTKLIDAGEGNLYLALVWLVKLVTDPLTDIVAYSPRYLRRP